MKKVILPSVLVAGMGIGAIAHAEPVQESVLNFTDTQIADLLEKNQILDRENSLIYLSKMKQIDKIKLYQSLKSKNINAPELGTHMVGM